MKQKWLFRALMIFFCLTFLVSGFFLARYYWNGYQQKQQANALSDIVEQAKKDTTPVQTTPPDTADPTDPSAPSVPAASHSTASSEHVLVDDPITGEKISLLREYAPIYLMNTDTVGWIKIEDTDINYPVMQTPDNVDFYLKRNFEKEYDSHGCIYVREQCDVFKPSDNLTIYGHRMYDGAMFWDLQYYKKPDFWQEHRYITFDTIQEHHTYEIFSVFLTTASVGEGFSYHEFEDAASEEEFDDYVATCKRLALYDTGITPQYGDKLITLSTCEYSQTNGRLVVVARRITE